MKTSPLNPSNLAATAALAMLLPAGTHAMAEEKPAEAKLPTSGTPVTFRILVLTANPYLTTSAKGGLVANAEENISRQTFFIVDLNGGDIVDSDSIQIKWAPTGAKPTYWHEGEGAVSRVGGKPDATCSFKIKIKEKSKDAAGKEFPKSIVLQTASGKFVTVPAKGATLATTEGEDSATIFAVTAAPVPTAAE